MKRIKMKTSKILLSLTMVFAMALTIAPTNVFATESANVPTVATSIDNSNIIIDGNNGYTIDYFGITKAFNEIADGGTITLGGNVRMDMGTFQLRGSKSITLDLNGYTIDYSQATSLITLFDTYDLTMKDTKTGGTIINNEDGVIYLGDDSSLTIESGTFISSEDLKPSIINNSTGDVKIKGGTIENLVSETGIGGTAIMNQSTGNVIIEGGLIKATAPYMSTGIQNTGNGSIIISGGIIKAENGSVSNNAIDNMSAGQVIVSGGNIVSSMKAYSKKGAEDITIDGGNFIGTIDGTPKNSANTAVYLTTLVLKDVLADTEVSSITGGNGYNVSGVKTDSAGKIQIWLPESTTITAISTLTNNYTGTVTTNTRGTASGTFTEAIDLPDYTGTEAGAPSNTPTSKTDTSITLTSVVVSGETIEYAKSTSSVAPTADSDWQTSAIFTGLTANTEYYFFARVKASTSHKVGAVSTGTMIKTDKSNLQKINEAKPLAQSAITVITATNSTTAEIILDAVTTGIFSVDGVSASWKTAPTITPATSSNAGSITGTIVLTCGSETVEVTVNKILEQLAKTDKEKVDEAKPLAESAITAITVTNDTTAGNILDAVTTGISSVDGVSVSWKTTPTITPATSSNTGSITGTIVLTCGSETVEVVVSKILNKLSKPTPETPTITAGAGAIYQIRNGKDLTLTCTGLLEDLKGIYVDGKLVDKSNYTLKSGSTILTLKASYLDTLATGKHTLKFQYKDNEFAETDFTITAKEAPKKDVVIKDTASPMPNGSMNSIMYVSIVVLFGCVASTKMGKRKKESNK